MLFYNLLQCQNLWPKIVTGALVNRGCSFQRKTILDSKKLVFNSMLWGFGGLGKVALRHIYEVEDVTHMYIYKDKLILKTDAEVTYFDVKSTKKIKSHLSTGEADYVENDHMVVITLENDNLLGDIYLYGKPEPDSTIYDTTKENDLYVMRNIQVYSLEDDICYMVTDRNVVWALIWDRKQWSLKMRGRYYGDAGKKICALNIHDNRVTMATELGSMWREDADFTKFSKISDISSMVHLPSMNSGWALFNAADVAMPVPKRSPRIKLFHNTKLNQMRLECSEMTCATPHGEILFLGFEDGTVRNTSIYLTFKLFNCLGDPDISGYFFSFVQLPDPKLTSTNVSFINLHILFKIIQTPVTYC
uniref:SFRICE_014678 n=1 Tax=Spodoptera frugiperda TaxID=7108 RepID=A0A2H1VNR7_SPOFR